MVHPSITVLRCYCTVVKAVSNSKLKSAVFCVCDSLDLNSIFTFAKNSSLGFKSGEYGGKKCTIAPMSWINVTTP